MEQMVKWPKQQVGTGEFRLLVPGSRSMSTGTSFTVRKLVSMNNRGSEELPQSLPLIITVSPGTWCWEDAVQSYCTFLSSTWFLPCQMLYEMPFPHCCQVVIANQKNRDLRKWLLFIDGILPSLKSHNPSISTSLCRFPSVFWFPASCKC